jgi:predicted esterase
VHELRAADPEVLREIEARLGTDDLEAHLFDVLARAGAPTSVKDLGVTLEKLDELLPKMPAASRAVLRNAYHGRRPSSALRQEDVGTSELCAAFGPPLDRARAVIVALHGRSSTAEAIVGRARDILDGDESVAVLAPQSTDNEWYSGRNFEPRAKLGEELERAVREVSALLDRVFRTVPRERVVLMGFSQGACLATEVFTRRSERLGGLLVLSGAVIGKPSEDRPPGAAASGTPVLVGASEGDPWVTPAAIERTALLLERAGCIVTRRFVPGAAHAIHDVHREEARKILRELRIERDAFR